MNKVARLGEQALAVLEGLGAFVRFALGILLRSSALLAKPALWVRAMYQAGVLSLPIILVAGFFVGMVLAFQGFTTLVRFGAEQSLGIMVALSLMRELGSVVSALLFAGRAGSSITAEIGLMKTTEQLSAMEMMAIDPMAQVGLPRFWGGDVGIAFIGGAICGGGHCGGVCGGGVAFRGRCRGVLESNATRC